MVQFNSNREISIINPIELAANREANLLCPKVVMDDPELTLTLKLVEIKIFNLCIKKGSYKVRLSDALLSELTNRKERTVRGYVTKLNKLDRLEKLPCKEKGYYEVAFKNHEWMKLSSSELLAIDQDLNLLSSIALSSQSQSQLEQGTLPKEVIIDIEASEVPNSQLEAKAKVEAQIVTSIDVDIDLSQVGLTIEAPAINSSVEPQQLSIQSNQQIKVHPEPEASVIISTQTQIENITTLYDSDSDNNVANHNSPLALASTFLNSEPTSTTRVLSEIEAEAEKEEAERIYFELEEEQEDLLFPLFAIIEKQWGTNGKLAQLKTEWFKASEKDCWDDFLQEAILSEIKLGYASELKEVLAGNDYNDQDEAKNTAAFALLGRYEENQELETVETVEAKAETEAVTEIVEAVTEYLPQAVGELQPTSFSQNNQVSNNPQFPALGKEPIRNKETNSSNSNLVGSKPNTTHIAEANLANPCQNSVAANTLTSNVKIPNQSQAQNMARHCQDNQRRDTKLSLAKPSSPKPSQDWQSIGDVLGTSTSKSIIEQIISNVELAKSCQNAQTQSSKLSSSKENLANPCQNNPINQNQLVNPITNQTANPVANQKLGNGLPNTSPISQLIANSLITNSPLDKANPTMPVTKRPIVKNYFRDIED